MRPKLKTYLNRDLADFIGLAFMAQDTDGPGPFNESMRIARNGNVGIGTIAPQAKLSVNGTVLATEVNLKNDFSVPDYVFEEDYVREHKHLPDTPLAADIENEGLNLAEMNLLLLKKVEELTLHLIEKDKAEKRLAAEMAWLKSELASIKEH